MTTTIGKEINNELIIPSFWKFCRTLHLPLTFGEQNSESVQPWDPDSFYKEMLAGSHEEALDIFNSLRPEYCFYKGQVVRFRFTDSMGDSAYDIWPVKEFLNKASDKHFYLKVLEGRFNYVLQLAAIGWAILAFFFISWLTSALFPNSGSIGDWFTIALSGGIYYLIFSRAQRMPHKIAEGKEVALALERIERLRGKLAQRHSQQPLGTQSTPLSSLKQVKRLGLTPEKLVEVIREQVDGMQISGDSLAEAKDKSIPSETGQSLSLEDKAEEAPRSFKILLSAVQVRLEKTTPGLLIIPAWKNFSIAGTVAGCVLLAIRLGYDVPEENRTELELRMRESLNRIYPNTERLYADCHNVLLGSLADIPRNERPRHIFPLVAAWVVTITTGEKGGEAHAQIRKQLTQLYENETVGYWR